MTSEQLELFPNEPSSPLAGLARATHLGAVVAGWVTHARDCGCTSRDCWRNYVRPGSSARTSLAFSRSTTDETSAPSSGTWPSSGWTGPGGYWTLAVSEYPTDAADSSLSDILE